MDEPCSALDPIATARIEDLMEELSQVYTIVIVTHNMQQAARVADGQPSLRPFPVKTLVPAPGCWSSTTRPRGSLRIPLISAPRTTSRVASDDLTYQQKRHVSQAARNGALTSLGAIRWPYRVIAVESPSTCLRAATMSICSRAGLTCAPTPMGLRRC